MRNLLQDIGKRLCISVMNFKWLKYSLNAYFNNHDRQSLPTFTHLFYTASLKKCMRLCKITNSFNWKCFCGIDITKYLGFAYCYNPRKEQTCLDMFYRRSQLENKSFSSKILNISHIWYNMKRYVRSVYKRGTTSDDQNWRKKIIV